MATLAIQPVAATGTALSFAAATSGGDKCHVGDRSFLIVKNGSGASVTVTLATSETVDGFAVADNAVAVAAGAQTVIGPVERELYAATDGLCAITYSASASVTVASVQC
jgi:hypothetical protein